MGSNSMASAHVILKKIKGGCQSGRKVVTYNSKSDLPLGAYIYLDTTYISQGYSKTFF